MIAMIERKIGFGEKERIEMPLEIGRENSFLVLIDYWIEAIDTTISRPSFSSRYSSIDSLMFVLAIYTYVCMCGTSVRGYLSFISSVLLPLFFCYSLCLKVRGRREKKIYNPPT